MVETAAPTLSVPQQRAIEIYNELFLSPDPELRKKVRDKIKEKFPDVQLPADEIEPLVAPIRAENAELKKSLDELTKKFEAGEKKTAEQSALEKMQGGVEEAVREYSLTDDGRAKMLERMKETGNYTDPAAAAAWVASKAPPPPSPGPTWATQNLDLFGSQNKDEQFAALHRDPLKYLDDQLVEFTRNPDKYVSETLGRQ